MNSGDAIRGSDPSQTCLRAARWTTTGAAWCLLALALCAWAALYFSDVYWPATLLDFAPQWVLLAAIGLVAICALFWQPRALVPLVLAAAIVAVPVMQFAMPVGLWLRGRSTGRTLRILTCNTCVGRGERGLAALLRREQPDVVVLQEWPEERPLESLFDATWQLIKSEDVVIASRLPGRAIERFAAPDNPLRTIALRCELDTALGPIDFYGVHLLSPRSGLQAVLSGGWSGRFALREITATRQREAAALGRWIGDHPGAKVLAGDFNLTPHSAIYRREFGHLQDAFASAGWGWGGTKYTRIHSVCIDHVLADASFSFTRGTVGPDVGSDHRPVIAELKLQNVPGSGGQSMAQHLAPATP